MSRLGLGLGIGVSARHGTAPAPPDPPPQYPTLLNAYVARPPWLVMGVDVGAGPPTDQVFKNPAIDPMPAGASANAGTSQITISADNVTLDGWDFGEWQVINHNANLTLSNFKWMNGAANQPLLNNVAGSGSTTITAGIIDGANLTTGLGGVIHVGDGGTFTITNNWIKNAWDQAIFFGSNSPAVVAAIMENNLFENVGAGSLATPSQHCDVLLCVGTANYTITWNRNTWVQTADSYGTQGVSCQDNTFRPVCQSAQYNQNVFALNTAPVGSGGVSYAVIVDTSELVTVAEVQDNYVDPTGIDFGFLLVRSDGGGPYSGTVSASGNINMLTGGSIS